MSGENGVGRTTAAGVGATVSAPPVARVVGVRSDWKVDRGPVVSRIDAFSLRLRGRQQEGAVGGVAAKRRADWMVDLLRCQGRRQGRRQQADRADKTCDPKSSFTHSPTAPFEITPQSLQTIRHLTTTTLPTRKIWAGGAPFGCRKSSVPFDCRPISRSTGGVPAAGAHRP